MKGTLSFESRFCALPMDTNGIFKLFWMSATIPVALAAQERATAEAVLASYRPSLDSLKWLLAPNGMGGAANETITCIDLGVIREEPESRLPSYCR